MRSAWLAVVMFLAACASSADQSLGSGGDTRAPYAGALYLAAPNGGAAARIVRCAYPAILGSSASPYVNGAVGRTADGALDDARNVVSVDVALLHAERRDADRVLYTTVYDGRALQALIVHYGPASRGTGADRNGKGWYPESWASCDVSEFPDAVARKQNVEVWTDASGRRIDTRRVVSFSSEECLAEDTVTVGKRVFMRRPLDASYGEIRFRAHLRLPADAIDTGWSHGSRHLWLSRTIRAAYLGSGPSDVERWPELTARLGCG